MDRTQCWSSSASVNMQTRCGTYSRRGEVVRPFLRWVRWAMAHHLRRWWPSRWQLAGQIRCRYGCYNLDGHMYGQSQVFCCAIANFLTIYALYHTHRPRYNSLPSLRLISGVLSFWFSSVSGSLSKIPSDLSDSFWQYNFPVFDTFLSFHINRGDLRK